MTGGAHGHVFDGGFGIRWRSRWLPPMRC